MTYLQFSRQLVFYALLAAALSVLSLQWKPIFLADQHGLSIWTLGGFTFLLILVFFFAKKAAQSSNPHFFTQFFLIATFAKLIGSASLILWYKKSYEPESSLFIIPFFLQYIVFSYFEARFLIALSKEGPKKEA